MMVASAEGKKTRLGVRRSVRCKEENSSLDEGMKEDR